MLCVGLMKIVIDLCSRLSIQGSMWYHSRADVSLTHDLKKEASEKERAINTGEKEVELEGERKGYLGHGGCLVKLKIPPHQ